jgi:succinyl-CoA synthetase beta subunit
VVTQDLTVTAAGIVQAYKELAPQVPFVVRLAGNRDREAHALLTAGGIEHVFRREDQIEACVEKLKTLMAAGAVTSLRESR